MKTELQRFADETGLKISVCHFPPGTSKWNKIEHRMFSHISQNWHERPLVSIETIVNLIKVTKTKNGLKIQTSVDINEYVKRTKIRDKEIKTLASKEKHYMTNGVTHYIRGRLIRLIFCNASYVKEVC